MLLLRLFAVSALVSLGLAGLPAASAEGLGSAAPQLGPRGAVGLPGLPGLPGPRRGTVDQALGCRAARCSPADRSCVELHGRGTYRLCPQILHRFHR